MKCFNKMIIGLLLILNMPVQASSFKGYKRQPTSEVLKYIETIERFKETPQEFLILISKHAAFYKFPKTTPYTDEVRDYLNNRKKNKSLVTFEVDPVTAEILNISDTQK